MFGSQSVFRKGRESPPSDYNDDSTLLQCIFYSIAVVVFFAFMCFNVRTCMCVCKLKGTCVPCLHVCTNNNADSSNRLDTVLRMVYASAYPYTCIYVYNHVLLITDRRIRTALQILYKY